MAIDTLRPLRSRHTRTNRDGPIDNAHPDSHPDSHSDPVQGRRCAQRGGHRRVPTPKWPADPAGSRRLQADNDRQHYLSRRIAPRELWRDRDGPSARALAIQGLAAVSNGLGRVQQTRFASQWHHQHRPHQLLRQPERQRGQLALVPLVGGGLDGELLHRQNRSRQRDDRRPQRNGAGRKQPVSGPLLKDAGDDVPVA